MGVECWWAPPKGKARGVLEDPVRPYGCCWVRWGRGGAISHTADVLVPSACWPLTDSLFKKPKAVNMLWDFVGHRDFNGAVGYENSQVGKIIGVGSGLLLQQSFSPVSGREQLSAGEPQHVLMKVAVVSQRGPIGSWDLPP